MLSGQVHKNKPKSIYIITHMCIIRKNKKVIECLEEGSSEEWCGDTS